MNQDAEQAAKLFIFEINENENIQVTWDVFFILYCFRAIGASYTFQNLIIKSNSTNNSALTLAC